MAFSYSSLILVFEIEIFTSLLSSDSDNILIISKIVLRGIIIAGILIAPLASFFSILANLCPSVAIALITSLPLLSLVS